MNKKAKKPKFVNWLFGKNGALFHACAKGNLDVAQELVEEGANVNLTSLNGYTPLHRASQNGHKEIVSFLLAQGADPKAKAEDGITATALAEKNGHADIVALLGANS